MVNQSAAERSEHEPVADESVVQVPDVLDHCPELAFCDHVLLGHAD